jgi:hypothetical protein
MLPDNEIANRAMRLAPRRFYQTLSEIALIEPPVKGVATGWPDVDRILSGGAIDASIGLQPNRLNEAVGYTSHGKTNGMLSIMLHNLESGMLQVIASGDDSPEALLWKIIAMQQNMHITDVMAQTKQWRNHIIAEHLEGRIIIATPLGDEDWNAGNIAVLIESIQQDVNRKVDLFCFDYLGTMKEAANGQIASGASQFKKIVRTFPQTVFLLGHQCNRSIVTGSAGNGLETKHIEYGGVKECDGVIIGFRRRVDTEVLTDEIRNHEELVPTTNINVIKNKPTGTISSPTGYRHAIDTTSGRIIPLKRDEQHHNVKSIQEFKMQHPSMRSGD